MTPRVLLCVAGPLFAVALLVRLAFRGEVRLLEALLCEPVAFRVSAAFTLASVLLAGVAGALWAWGSP